MWIFDERLIAGIERECVCKLFSRREKLSPFFFLINTRFILYVVLRETIHSILLIIHLGDISMKNAFVKIRIV